MEMSVCKTFTFDAAHYLPGHPGKCSNMHGHTWTLEVEVTGEKNVGTGMVTDFAELKDLVDKTIIDRLDHTLLNVIIPNPTCEEIVIWISNQLFINLQSVRLGRIRLYETPGSFAELKL